MTSIRFCDPEYLTRLTNRCLHDPADTELAHVLGLAHYWQAHHTGQREHWECVIAYWALVFEDDGYWANWRTAREPVFGVPINAEHIAKTRQALAAQLADTLAGFDRASPPDNNPRLEYVFYLETAAIQLLERLHRERGEEPVCGPLFAQVAGVPRAVEHLLKRLPGAIPSNYETLRFMLAPIQEADEAAPINERRMLERRIQFAFSRLGVAWVALERNNPTLALDLIGALHCPDNDGVHTQVTLPEAIARAPFKRCHDDCTTFQRDNPAYAVLDHGADLFFHHLIELAARASLAIAAQNMRANPIHSGTVAAAVHDALALSQVIDMHETLRPSVSKTILRWANTLEQDQRLDECVALLDRYGVACSPQPYSPAALAAFENAHAFDEEDCDAIHHLAIAHHARAWDMELDGDPGAYAAWETALNTWNKLKNCGAFWQRLIDRGTALWGAEFDPGVIEDYRHNLLDYLLAVHIDFIQHYAEQHLPDRVSQHINLIRRAHIRPAAKKQFEDRIFKAITRPVARLKAQQDYDGTLRTLERYLELVNDYPPAFQEYLETAATWIEQFQPLNQWDAIMALAQRVAPVWEALETIWPEVSQSNARAALVKAARSDYARRLGEKYYLRANHIRLQREQAGDPSQGVYSDEYDLYGSAVLWMLRVDLHEPGSRDAVMQFGNAAITRFNLLVETWNTQQSRLSAQHMTDSLSEVRQVAAVHAEEPFITRLPVRILHLRAMLQLNRFVAGLNASQVDPDLLHAAQGDCDAARQLAPDDPDLETLANEIVKRIKYSR